MTAPTSAAHAPASVPLGLLRASVPVQAGTFTPEAMGRAGWHALRMVTS